jgi:hypothetical protein
MAFPYRNAQQYAREQMLCLMVLVWQVGTVFILTAMAAWAGPYLLSWRSIIRTNRRSVLT